MVNGNSRCINQDGLYAEVDMNTIQIGKIIAAHRKEKGATQEELANHLGVSKPAVSKWESGQSYPDILLLPELASYFNITVDLLIGYEPQMTDEDVRKLYHRLAAAFAREPFEKVYEKCQENIKKYFSCWYLQYEMALLLVNHCNLSGSPEKSMIILEKALEIFTRVEKSCDEVALAKQALQMEALCHLSLSRPSEAIDILENLDNPLISTQSLMVKAYQAKGDSKKAIEHLQGYTYVNLVTILGAAPDYFHMYASQPDRMDQYYKLFCGLGELFEVEELHPVMLIQIHLSAAMVYTSVGNYQAALSALEKYVELAVRSDKANFTLHGNRIFDALDYYLKDVIQETNMPRSAKMIWEDIRTMLNNPVFAALEQEPKFKQLKKRLEGC